MLSCVFGQLSCRAKALVFVVVCVCSRFVQSNTYCLICFEAFSSLGNDYGHLFVEVIRRLQKGLAALKH
jgi:hypothetical protein